MNIWPLSALLTIVLLTSVILFLMSHLYLTHRSHQKSHHLEPPLIPPAIPIPYLGHLLALAQQGGHYIRELGLAHALPIFTLVMPFSRLYIVTAPNLAAAIQRKPETELSFHALLPEVVQRVMGLDKATRAIIQRGVVSAEEDGGVLAELHAMLNRELGPGRGDREFALQAVCKLNRGMEAVAADLLRRKGTGASTTPVMELDLLDWLRYLVAHDTARHFYGDRNPLERWPEKRLDEALWAFDHGLGRLLIGVFPSLTARAAYTGREKLVAAFRHYLEVRDYEGAQGANMIVLCRIRIAEAHGFGLDGIARSELSFLYAGIVNTATTTFWMLVRLFADEELLKAVRAELEQLVKLTTSSADEVVRQLSLKELQTKERCPLLHAVLAEVLRLGSNHSSTRLVREDTLLSAASDAVWLRKGGVVQIASGVMHTNPEIWGEDARSFNPYRHLKQGQDGAWAMASTRAAFRPFGGGRTICPGRHFAASEILGLVSFVLLRFEMEGAGEDGKIQVPELDDHILPVHILEPVAGSPVRVKFRLREGLDGGKVEVTRPWDE